MTEKVKSTAFYSDLVDAPPDRIAELVGSALYLSPRPSPKHANAATVLGADLHDAFDRGRRGPGGWRVLFEPELHVGNDVLIPDLAAWRRERLPELGDANGIDVVPDWVCEIVSRSTERFDRTEKLPRYATAGVGYAWLVDPVTRCVEVLSRAGDSWRVVETHSGDTLVCAPPFEAVTIELAALWR